MAEVEREVPLPFDGPVTPLPSSLRDEADTFSPLAWLMEPLENGIQATEGVEEPWFDFKLENADSDDPALVMSDNGRGMSLEVMEGYMRPGFTTSRLPALPRGDEPLAFRHFINRHLSRFGRGCLALLYWGDKVEIRSEQADQPEPRVEYCVRLDYGPALRSDQWEDVQKTAFKTDVLESSPGTTIRITRLRRHVLKLLRDPAFTTKVAKQVAEVYHLYVHGFPPRIWGRLPPELTRGCERPAGGLTINFFDTSPGGRPIKPMPYGQDSAGAAEVEGDHITDLYRSFAALEGLLAAKPHLELCVIAQRCLPLGHPAPGEPGHGDYSRLPRYDTCPEGGQQQEQGAGSGGTGAAGSRGQENGGAGGSGASGAAAAAGPPRPPPCSDKNMRPLEVLSDLLYIFAYMPTQSGKRTKPPAVDAAGEICLFSMWSGKGLPEAKLRHFPPFHGVAVEKARAHPATQIHAHKLGDPSRLVGVLLASPDTPVHHHKTRFHGLVNEMLMAPGCKSDMPGLADGGVTYTYVWPAREDGWDGGAADAARLLAEAAAGSGGPADAARTSSGRKGGAGREAPCAFDEEEYGYVEQGDAYRIGDLELRVGEMVRYTKDSAQGLHKLDTLTSQPHRLVSLMHVIEKFFTRGSYAASQHFAVVRPWRPSWAPKAEAYVVHVCMLQPVLLLQNGGSSLERRLEEQAELIQGWEAEAPHSVAFSPAPPRWYSNTGSSLEVVSLVMLPRNGGGGGGGRGRKGKKAASASNATGAGPSDGAGPSRPAAADPAAEPVDVPCTRVAFTGYLATATLTIERLHDGGEPKELVGTTEVFVDGRLTISLQGKEQWATELRRLGKYRMRVTVEEKKFKLLKPDCLTLCHEFEVKHGDPASLRVAFSAPPPPFIRLGSPLPELRVQLLDQQGAPVPFEQSQMDGLMARANELLALSAAKLTSPDGAEARLSARSLAVAFEDDAMAMRITGVSTTPRQSLRAPGQELCKGAQPGSNLDVFITDGAGNSYHHGPDEPALTVTLTCTSTAPGPRDPPVRLCRQQGAHHTVFENARDFEVRDCRLVIPRELLAVTGMPGDTGTLELKLRALAMAAATSPYTITTHVRVKEVRREYFADGARMVYVRPNGDALQSRDEVLKFASTVMGDSARPSIEQCFVLRPQCRSLAGLRVAFADAHDDRVDKNFSARVKVFVGSREAYPQVLLVKEGRVLLPRLDLELHADELASGRTVTVSVRDEERDSVVYCSFYVRQEPHPVALRLAPYSCGLLRGAHVEYSELSEPGSAAAAAVPPPQQKARAGPSAAATSGRVAGVLEEPPAAGGGEALLRLRSGSGRHARIVDARDLLAHGFAFARQWKMDIRQDEVLQVPLVLIDQQGFPIAASEDLRRLLAEKAGVTVLSSERPSGRNIPDPRWSVEGCDIIPSVEEGDGGALPPLLVFKVKVSQGLGPTTLRLEYSPRRTTAVGSREYCPPLDVSIPLRIASGPLAPDGYVLRGAPPAQVSLLDEHPDRSPEERLALPAPPQCNRIYRVAAKELSQLHLSGELQDGKGCRLNMPVTFEVEAGAELGLGVRARRLEARDGVLQLPAISLGAGAEWRGRTKLLVLRPTEGHIDAAGAVLPLCLYIEVEPGSYPVALELRDGGMPAAGGPLRLSSATTPDGRHALLPLDFSVAVLSADGGTLPAASLRPLELRYERRVADAWEPFGGLAMQPLRPVEAALFRVEAATLPMPTAVDDTRWRLTASYGEAGGEQGNHAPGNRLPPLVVAEFSIAPGPPCTMRLSEQATAALGQQHMPQQVAASAGALAAVGLPALSGIVTDRYGNPSPPAVGSSWRVALNVRLLVRGYGGVGPSAGADPVPVPGPSPPAKHTLASCPVRHSDGSFSLPPTSLAGCQLPADADYTVALELEENQGPGPGRCGDTRMAGRDAVCETSGIVLPPLQLQLLEVRVEPEAVEMDVGEEDEQERDEQEPEQEEQEKEQEEQEGEQEGEQEEEQEKEQEGEQEEEHEEREQEELKQEQEGDLKEEENEEEEAAAVRFGQPSKLQPEEPPAAPPTEHPVRSPEEQQALPTPQQCGRIFRVAAKEGSQLAITLGLADGEGRRLAEPGTFELLGSPDFGLLLGGLGQPLEAHDGVLQLPALTLGAGPNWRGNTKLLVLRPSSANLEHALPLCIYVDVLPGSYPSHLELRSVSEVPGGVLRLPSLALTGVGAAAVPRLPLAFDLAVISADGRTLTASSLEGLQLQYEWQEGGSSWVPLASMAVPPLFRVGAGQLPMPSEAGARQWRLVASYTGDDVPAPGNRLAPLVVSEFTIAPGPPSALQLSEQSAAAARQPHAGVHTPAELPQVAFHEITGRLVDGYGNPSPPASGSSWRVALHVRLLAQGDGPSAGPGPGPSSPAKHTLASCPVRHSDAGFSLPPTSLAGCRLPADADYTVALELEADQGSGPGRGGQAAHGVAPVQMRKFFLATTGSRELAEEVARLQEQASLGRKQQELQARLAAGPQAQQPVPAFVPLRVLAPAGHGVAAQVQQLRAAFQGWSGVLGPLCTLGAVEREDTGRALAELGYDPRLMICVGRAVTMRVKAALRSMPACQGVSALDISNPDLFGVYDLRPNAVDPSHPQNAMPQGVAPVGFAANLVHLRDEHVQMRIPITYRGRPMQVTLRQSLWCRIFRDALVFEAGDHIEAFRDRCLSLGQTVCCKLIALDGSGGYNLSGLGTEAVDNGPPPITCLSGVPADRLVALGADGRSAGALDARIRREQVELFAASRRCNQLQQLEDDLTAAAGLLQQQLAQQQPPGQADMQRAAAEAALQNLRAELSAAEGKLRDLRARQGMQGRHADALQQAEGARHQQPQPQQGREPQAQPAARRFGSGIRRSAQGRAQDDATAQQDVVGPHLDQQAGTLRHEMGQAGGADGGRVPGGRGVMAVGAGAEGRDRAGPGDKARSGGGQGGSAGGAGGGGAGAGKRNAPGGPDDGDDGGAGAAAGDGGRRTRSRV
ncbi:hypothetical protein GPECTOR_2g1275 [Gonium pectorale]|uniref:Uncharacterized protein n=1 Tax=Gonium pectorale TaxID=33097 RepID=A0A150H0X6_GONPE|nr:hypothetical protein GPECTOR_2g1275 [Gonium pectorale]|eukprot:KXZ55725.1 hypothetical protein GPECTOR_2g1275 [Gonium pectorale]